MSYFYGSYFHDAYFNNSYWFVTQTNESGATPVPDSPKSKVGIRCRVTKGNLEKTLTVGMIKVTSRSNSVAYLPAITVCRQLTYYDSQQ